MIHNDRYSRVLYYLSGLTCTDENARTKAQFAQEAGRVGLAVVFPDTSIYFFHNFTNMQHKE